MRLEAQRLGVVLKGRQILSEIDLVMEPGRLTAIVGPNGAGKSTLLRALAGIVTPACGRVRLDGRLIDHWDRMARARVLAYLPQDHTVHWPLSARAVAALGRLPHRPAGMGESPADAAAILAALSAVDVAALAERPVLELSGGERARVLVARALAQDPRVLLADEPIAGLDPGHQLALLHHFAMLARDQRAVLIALHDLSLAARFCHTTVLMQAGRIVADGRPMQVLTPARLAAVYGIRARCDVVDGVPIVLPLEVLP
jgi:iron complex transport system ATP-binding protein